jgi:hypothetical protein
MTQPNVQTKANAATETFRVTDTRTDRQWPIPLPAGKPKILIGSGDGVDVDIRLPGKHIDGIAPKQIILIRKQQTSVTQASQASAEQTILGHFQLLNLGVNKVTLQRNGRRQDIWPDGGPVTVAPGDEITVAGYTIAIPDRSKDTSLDPQSQSSESQLTSPEPAQPISDESDNFKVWLDHVPDKCVRPGQPLEVGVWIENKGSSDGAVFKVDVDGPPEEAVPPVPGPTIRKGQRAHYKFAVHHIKSPEQLAGKTKLVVRVHAPLYYGAETLQLPLDYSVEPRYAHTVTSDCQEQPREGKSAS